LARVSGHGEYMGWKIDLRNPDCSRRHYVSAISPFVMAGHSRPKDGVASARLCPGHPRLCRRESKTWMPGTRPGMKVNNCLKELEEG